MKAIMWTISCLIGILLIAACSPAPTSDNPAEPDASLVQPQTTVSAWVYQNNDPDNFGVLSTWAQNIQDYNSATSSANNQIDRVYVWLGSMMPPAGTDCASGLPICVQYAQITTKAINTLAKELPDVEFVGIVDTPSHADTNTVNRLSTQEVQLLADNVATTICAADLAGVAFDVEPLNLESSQTDLYSEVANKLAAGCDGSAGPVGIFGGTGTLVAQLAAAKSLVSHPNIFFELSVYDISDGTLANYRKAVDNILHNQAPKLAQNNIPYSFALPAAGSAAEHECVGKVDGTKPPPYYDLAACAKLIDNQKTNPQIAYINEFVEAITDPAAADVFSQSFRGYSLYQWGYPLGKKVPLPNVPPPGNGGTSDLLQCLQDHLPFTPSPASVSC